MYFFPPFIDLQYPPGLCFVYCPNQQGCSAQWRERKHLKMCQFLQHEVPNQHGCSAQWKLSRGFTQCIADFAGLPPNCTLSRHLQTIIINVVLCFTHLCVHFGIKSYAQSGLVDKIGILLLFWNSVGNLLRVHCWLGWHYHFETSLDIPQTRTAVYN